MTKTYTKSYYDISKKLKPFSFNERTVYYISNGKTILPKIYDLNLLKSNLAKNGFDFIHFSHNTEDVFNLLTLYKYYNPKFDISKELPSDNNYFKYLLQLFEIEDNINDIFVYTHYGELVIITFSVIYDGIIGFEDLDTFLFNFPTESTRLEEGAFHSRYSFSDGNENERDIPFEENIQKIVDEIKEQLEGLKKTGQFLAILPFIQHHINEIKETKDKVSRLYIDEDYRIFLPDYNNIEIKLSHLTKALYFWFLLVDQVDLSDLKDFEADLLIIYKHISYQENHEKMAKSISDLVENSNDEIYVHFSRIKSAFCKSIDKSIVKKYYILGDRNKPKRIQLDRSLTNIKDFINKWFPNDERFSSWFQPSPTTKTLEEMSDEDLYNLL
ncbi:hypothetical protein SAMN02927937_00453 [Paenimyroides aquimaris]|uniref:Uncharacterized protein n=1 Tax=Paenimyroides marinum TaxID=1159016 RepID=A0A1H6JMX9_9FLAO|nr:hypothetical protein [Paenimyroides aquimaris]SEH61130.1 hypothetical protein SAMN02927937_00453 [Paenimyroides aquimaris]